MEDCSKRSWPWGSETQIDFGLSTGQSEIGHMELHLGVRSWQLDDVVRRVGVVC